MFLTLYCFLLSRSSFLGRKRFSTSLKGRAFVSERRNQRFRLESRHQQQAGGSWSRKEPRLSRPLRPPLQQGRVPQRDARLYSTRAGKGVQEAFGCCGPFKALLPSQVHVKVTVLYL